MAKKIVLEKIDETTVAWKRNRYEILPVYQGRDSKLYPIIGRLKFRKDDPTKIDIPFFFDPTKSFTTDATSIKNGIVKIFNTADGRECRIVIAEVAADISYEMFVKVVEDNILAYLNRNK